jgi:hypothetical protein
MAMAWRSLVDLLFSTRRQLPVWSPASAPPATLDDARRRPTELDLEALLVGIGQTGQRDEQIATGLANLLWRRNAVSRAPRYAIGLSTESYAEPHTARDITPLRPSKQLCVALSAGNAAYTVGIYRRRIPSRWGEGWALQAA